MQNNTYKLIVIDLLSTGSGWILLVDMKYLRLQSESLQIVINYYNTIQIFKFDYRIKEPSKHLLNEGEIWIKLKASTMDYNTPK